MRPALAHRFGSAVVAAPDSATLPGVKNRRKTCPKIISSANNATASEKIIPPTTAMNVIAICILVPSPKFFRILSAANSFQSMPEAGSRKPEARTPLAARKPISQDEHQPLLG